MSCSHRANKEYLNLKAGEEGGGRAVLRTENATFSVSYLTINSSCIPAHSVDTCKYTHAHTHSVYITKQEESDSQPECIIADKDKVFHEQGDKVHIKLALALSIAALQQKWMPCISE